MTPPNDDAATAPADRSRRATARDSLALVAGTAVTGLLSYAFVALSTRTLGAEGAAPIAQLWTYWTAAAAVVTFPVQHWIIRTVHLSDGVARVRRTLPRVTAVVLALAFAAGAASWFVRELVFTRDDVAFPVLVAATTVAAYVVGVVRGRLAGARRFVATAVAIASENLLRVVLALLVIALGGDVVAFGIALAAGGLAVLAWPSAFRFGAHGGRGSRSPLRVLGGIAAGSLIAQLVLTGGPVALAAIGGGPRAITELFVALALFRAPYLIALGLVVQVTGALTELIMSGRHRTLRRIRRALVAGTPVAAAVGLGAAWSLGPAVIALVFDVTPPRWMTGLVAAASTVALANLALIVLLVARQASGALTRSWLAAVVVGAVVLVTVGGAPSLAVAWAFLSAEIAAFALMWVAERHAAGRAVVTAPGSAPAGHAAASRPTA